MRLSDRNGLLYHLSNLSGLLICFVFLSCTGYSQNMMPPPTSGTMFPGGSAGGAPPSSGASSSKIPTSMPPQGGGPPSGQPMQSPYAQHYPHPQGMCTISLR